MATHSRARHFHATAKALSAAAQSRVDAGVDLAAPAANLDLAAMMAGSRLAPPATDPPANGEAPPSADPAPMLPSIQLPPVTVSGDELRTLHEEYRWADSKLMHASERLAEAQDQRRKDLVALAIMRRELQCSFLSERAWVMASVRIFEDSVPVLSERETELAALVDAGVRTEGVIHELAVIRAERKLFDLALHQAAAQLGRIGDSEATMEYQVTSEAYDREPDGESMRELARLRSLSTMRRRESVRLQGEAVAALDVLGIDRTHGEVTATHAFLTGEFEGEKRAGERMDAVRTAQAMRELDSLPRPESAWKAGLRHPVHFMRARRTTQG